MAIAEPTTAWKRACPHCGAELQEAARRCWQCRADFPAEGVDESDFSPTDPESTWAGTAGVLLAVGLGTLVISFFFFILWMTVASYFFLW